MCTETHHMASNCNSFGLKLSKSEFTLFQLDLGGTWELGWHSMICTLVSGMIIFSCNLRIQFYVGSMVNFFICFSSGFLVPLTSNSRKSSNLWPTFFSMLFPIHVTIIMRICFLIKNLKQRQEQNLARYLRCLLSFCYLL